MRDLALAITTDEMGVVDLQEKLRVAVTQPEMPDSGDFVRVMSLHKSKGLTSKVVIVTDCVEGLVPLIDYDASPEEQEATLREQRRLFYVAITRCTEFLVLSSVARLKWKLAKKIGLLLQGGSGEYGETVASRFLHEVGSTAGLARSGPEFLASLK
jgi:superfamily I DNA/RNA helicase